MNNTFFKNFLDLSIHNYSEYKLISTSCQVWDWKMWSSLNWGAVVKKCLIQLSQHSQQPISMSTLSTEYNSLTTTSTSKGWGTQTFTRHPVPLAYIFPTEFIFRPARLLYTHTFVHILVHLFYHTRRCYFSHLCIFILLAAYLNVVASSFLAFVWPFECVGLSFFDVVISPLPAHRDRILSD